MTVRWIAAHGALAALWLAAPAQAGTGDPRADAASLDEIRAAAREARAAADRAEDAARRAEAAAQVAEERAGGASARTVTAARDEPPQADGCSLADETAQKAYYYQVDRCEKDALVLLDASEPVALIEVKPEVVAASSGSAAQLTLSRKRLTRTLSHDRPPAQDEDEWQRVRQSTATLGVRTLLDTGDKSNGTIYSIGAVDRLASDIAVFGSFEIDFLTAQTKEGVIRQAGEAYATDEINLRARCKAARTKDAKIDCTGPGLIRWLLTRKEGKPVDQAALDAYNAVFWGPPKQDKAGRWGFRVDAELALPQFRYYPFALVQVADPFKPGSQKTVIDPASFPADFGANIVERRRLNWVLGGTAFFHLSRWRLGNTYPALRRQLGWNYGTTFAGGISYVRQDQIDAAFKDVTVCPPDPAQPVQTNLACTKVSIAAPVRKDGVTISGELRQGFGSVVGLPPTMLSARLSHNLDTDESALAVPFLFQTNSDGSFGGGLRYMRKWGGVDATGAAKPSESLLGIVVGTSLTISGAK